VRFVFIAERLSLVLANGPGRGFSGGDDGLGSANVINTVHPLCAVAVAGCSTVACRTPRHPARGFGEAGRPGRGRVSPGLPCCRPARSQPTPRLIWASALWASANSRTTMLALSGKRSRSPSVPHTGLEAGQPIPPGAATRGMGSRSARPDHDRPACPECLGGPVARTAQRRSGTGSRAAGAGR
jgi:hypothetical protein